jgi:hypothetical protein
VRRKKEFKLENQRLRKAVADLTLDKQILAEAARGNCPEPRASARLCPARKSQAEHLRASRLPHVWSAPLDMSCKVPRGQNDEKALTADIIALAREYGRYAYRKITALLQAAGWVVNAKRVERIWRREGVKVPQRQPKKGRLWLADGSCVRLRPEHPNHVWSYDLPSRDDRASCRSSPGARRCGKCAGGPSGCRSGGTPRNPGRWA